MLFTSHEEATGSAAFSPNGTSVIVASDDCTAKVWSSTTTECAATLHKRKDVVNSAVFSPDGTSVLTASDGHEPVLMSAGEGPPGVLTACARAVRDDARGRHAPQGLMTR